VKREMSSKGMANVVVVALLALTAPVVFALEVESTGVRHAAMVRAVEVDIRQASGETGKPELSPQVLKALGEAPRREFVPVNERDHAYENRPLPIGYGQTISQPTIVALMTELLDVKKEDVVLEVGTGSGYQAAVLTECAKQVYSFNDYRLKAGRLSRAYTSGKAKAIYGYSDESDSSLRSPSSTLAASSRTLKVWGSSNWFAM
jgi:hypothetical protein